MAWGCPRTNSFVYNATLCACDPGHVYERVGGTCELLNVSSSDWVVNSGVDYSGLNFPETIFSFDSIKKFTQSQAVFLEATAFMLLTWLLFCVFVRFRKLGDGRSMLFQIRWWISRLDICFSTRHWLVILCIYICIWLVCVFLITFAKALCSFSLYAFSYSLNCTLTAEMGSGPNSTIFPSQPLKVYFIGEVQFREYFPFNYTTLFAIIIIIITLTALFAYNLQFAFQLHYILLGVLAIFALILQFLSN